MSGAGGTTQKPQPAKRRATLQLTVLLAIVLLLLGEAGGSSLSLLRYAMRESTADDIAQLVCHAYEKQDYALLIAHVDPAPAPPDNVGAFDATAKGQLRTQLQTLDASAGKVTKCTEKSFRFGDTSAGTEKQVQYAFIMTRANNPDKPFNTLMTLVNVSGKGWLISRNSNFLGTQG
ncbi:MAG: hypothetical protein ACXWQ5_18750 [Ktedonobacterales bacterium]